MKKSLFNMEEKMKNNNKIYKFEELSQKSQTKAIKNIKKFIKENFNTNKVIKNEEIYDFIDSNNETFLKNGLISG